jgi:hypothetical protein
MGSAQWGNFHWGDAEWGVVDTLPPGTLAPAAATLALVGLVPTVILSNVDRTPPAGALVLVGAAPNAGVTLQVTPAVGSLALTGFAAELEQSDENRLGFQWAVLTPADLPLGFRWTVLPVVLAGGELGLTWVVVAEAPTLGFTWHVVPPAIFELFESEGVGAAAGIGEDVLLPVGRVTRE